MEATLAIDVKKFVPIATPDRLAAAAAGHHEPPRWTRQRPHGHLRPAGLVGHVRQPLSIGRYPCVVLGKWSRQDRLGRTAGLERHAPYISCLSTSPGDACVDNETAAVGGPVGRLAV